MPTLGSISQYKALPKITAFKKAGDQNRTALAKEINLEVWSIEKPSSGRDFLNLI